METTMRKLFTFLVALGAVVVVSLSAPTTVTGANTVWQPLFQRPDSCSQASNFLARTSGLTGTETTAYGVLICGLVTDGIITGTMNGANSGSGACGSTLDALYILATNNTTTASLNLCGTSYSLVTHGTTTFTPDTGIAGSTTGYLDTQFVVGSATTPNMTQNSGSFGAYDRTSSTVTSATATIMGAQYSSGQSYIQPLPSSTTIAADINSNTFAAAGTNSNRQGAWIVNRDPTNGATTVTIYGPHGSSTPLSSTSDASHAIAGVFSFVILAQGGSTPAKFSTDQISAAFIGGGLTGTQAAAINNRINAYMAALGVNIY
jgi:hypothetical protein